MEDPGKLRELASWYREFALVALHPFQAGPVSTLSAPDVAPEHMACGNCRVTRAR